MNSNVNSLPAEGSAEVSIETDLTDPRPIFLAMQGGGAKGIAHVGALSSIEKFDYKIRGVSGTSAGSMVAALVAAGYKADELVNLETREHLFSHSAETLGFEQPTAIFPGNGWKILRMWQRIGLGLAYLISAIITLFTYGKNSKTDRSNHDPLVGCKVLKEKLDPLAEKPGRLKRYWKLCVRSARSLVTWTWFTLKISADIFYVATLSLLLLIAIGFSVEYAVKIMPGATVIVVSLLIFFVLVIGRWIYKTLSGFFAGLNSVGNVSLLIDNAISEKLRANGYPNSGNITFRDLKKARSEKNPTIPLKIVATNVAHECLELFCEERTPDVKIGDAVAASVCLPFVFKPWNLSFNRHTETHVVAIDGQFLDGGLVSNLPAWPFDEERLQDPDVGTIALSIESEEVRGAKHWAAAALETVINGSSMVHTRATGSTLKIPLVPKLKMMAFGASAEAVRAEVYAASSVVTVRLTKELGTRNALEDAANHLHGWFVNAVQEGVGQWCREPLRPRVRVAIVAERGGNVATLSNVFTQGYYDAEVDRAVSRRSDCWIFKKAFEKRRPQLFPIPRRGVRVDEYKGERIWSGVRWVACFPIRLRSELEPGRRERLCAVVVDSTFPIHGDMPSVQLYLNSFMTNAFTEVLDYFDEHDLMRAVQGENTWI